MKRLSSKHKLLIWADVFSASYAWPFNFQYLISNQDGSILDDLYNVSTNFHSLDETQHLTSPHIVRNKTLNWLVMFP